MMATKAQGTVSARAFAAFYLIQRPACYTGNLLQRAARLYEAYIVDQYCKVVSQRLQYIEHNQEKLRCHLHSGLEDAAQKGDADASLLGKRVVLPSSFGGCPRALHALYQDGIAITRKRGRADLFITMTANPHWPEIAAALLPGQKTMDRPDLITRVFKLKLRSLLDDILKNGYLGQPAAHMYVIEFQKRGLPHVHILVTFANGYKLLSPVHYVHVICAEIPDQNADPELYDIIAKCYMHGPCGDMNSRCACIKMAVAQMGIQKSLQIQRWTRRMDARFTDGETMAAPCFVVGTLWTADGLLHMSVLWRNDTIVTSMWNIVPPLPPLSNRMSTSTKALIVVMW